MFGNWKATSQMNYTGVCRSNYFKVKDLKAFKATSPGSIEVHEKDGFVAIFGDDGWSSQIEDEEGNDVDFWVVEWVQEHLAEGEVALLVEAGYEGQRYVVGVGHLIGWDGKHAWVTLDDWANWKSRQLWGKPVSGAHY